MNADLDSKQYQRIEILRNSNTQINIIIIYQKATAGKIEKM